jgi:L-aminopeptidase/D-esterase-like protein
VALAHRHGRSIQKGRNTWNEQEADWLSHQRISALFDATAQATEEAIINALVAAETMTGANSRTVEAIPHDRLKEILKNITGWIVGKVSARQ